MSKKDKRQAAFEAWREAEDRFRSLAEPLLHDDGTARLSKDDALALMKASAKAERRLAAYLDHSLD